MTAPVTTEALVERLARDLAREGGWNDPDIPWTENQVIIARGGVGEPVWRDFVDDARSLLGRETFTTLLADLQQVTAERDAARAKQRDMHRRAQKAESFRERHRGGFRWLISSKRKERTARRIADAALATANAELARLRAEVEALVGALEHVKAWIDTDLPAGTSRAGTVHRAIANALDRTALAARAATAREG